MAKRDLLSLKDLTTQEVLDLISKGRTFRAQSEPALSQAPLRGKTLGLLFEKASTRTRVSFEVAMDQLGGHSVFLSMEDLQLRRGETIADTARVLSGYLGGLVVRTFGQDTLVQWAQSAAIPVINGLTDLHHPCQALGDLLTLQTRFGMLEGLKLAYVGDGNNVAHSLIEGGAKVGMHISLACPKGYGPVPAIIQAAQQEARRTGGSIELAKTPQKAVSGADALYTDVWVSMGKEREAKRRHKLLRPYQVNAKLLALAKPHAVVMHCLPAHRGQEITADVMDGPRSVVWEQAENRLHIQKAILEWLLG
jgi:ornithine carbamoyltransferase